MSEHFCDIRRNVIGAKFFRRLPLTNSRCRAHSLPLPDSTLVQRPLAPALWLLFAGSAYIDAHGSPQNTACRKGTCRMASPVWLANIGADVSYRLRLETLEQRPRRLAFELRARDGAAFPPSGLYWVVEIPDGGLE